MPSCSTLDGRRHSAKCAGTCLLVVTVRISLTKNYKTTAATGICGATVWGAAHLGWPAGTLVSYSLGGQFLGDSSKVLALMVRVRQLLVGRLPRAGRARIRGGAVGRLGVQTVHVKHGGACKGGWGGGSQGGEGETTALGAGRTSWRVPVGDKTRREGRCHRLGVAVRLCRPVAP